LPVYLGGAILRNKCIVEIDEGGNGREFATWCLSQGLHERSAQKAVMVPHIYGSRKTYDALAETVRDNDWNRIREFVDREVDGELYGEVSSRRPKKGELPKKALSFIAKQNREAVAEAVPSIDPAMGYIGSMAKILAAAGKPLRWMSPSGVPVCNAERLPDVTRPRLWLGGKPYQYPAALDYLPNLDEGECRKSAAPNFVHSLDASHLAFVTLACECEGIPLACVHDSFAVLPCHADGLREILMRELRAMYVNNDPLADLRASALRAHNEPLPDVPSPGTLDIDDVNGRYAFA
jgi:hypothetical protein